MDDMVLMRKADSMGVFVQFARFGSCWLLFHLAVITDIEILDVRFFFLSLQYLVGTYVLVSYVACTVY